MPNRPALITLLTFTVGLIAGSALILAGVALPLASVALSLAIAALAACVVLISSIPWQAGWLLAGLFAVVYANSHAPELESKSVTYLLSYLSTFAIVSLGLTWAGLAFGFLATRSRAGAIAIRAISVIAAMLSIVTLVNA